MTEYVLSIDPGLSTGVALLSYEDDNPAQLVEGWQFTGGVVGLTEWLMESLVDETVILPMGRVITGVRILSEKFTARATKGFSYTTASLEPLRGEGALIALGLMPDYSVAEKRWRDPAFQYFAGGTSKAEKKRRQHAFLKANGFYRTGKNFGTADADDFRSAASQGIVYIARELKHRPTFEWMSKGVEEL